MATPYFLPQTVSATLLAAGKQVVRVNTFQPDGTPLDVHTGFTLSSASAVCLQDYNSTAADGIDVSSAIAATFDATGMNLTIDGGIFAGAVPTLHQQVLLKLSNDSGSTQQLAAIANITVDNRGGAVS